MLTITVKGNKRGVQSFEREIKREFPTAEVAAPESYFIADYNGVVEVECSLPAAYYEISKLESKRWLYFSFIVRNAKAVFKKESGEFKFHSQLNNSPHGQRMKPVAMTAFKVDEEDDDTLGEYDDLELWEERQKCKT